MPETDLPAATDTIVACATPAGRGGVAVVRISGPAVPELAIALTGTLPVARHATLTAFRDASGEALDLGLALYFPAPHSFTGEYVLELHAHGGPVLIDALIERIVALGARLARPGEFTERAFLNDKLDLAQAEAIADLIDAGSRAAARAAQRSLRGDFSAAVLALNEQVTVLRTWVEAAIDFPDEDIDFLDADELRTRLAEVAAHFDALQATARQGCLLRDGLQVVIAGRPNAGKSSLLNALAGYDAAIVTAVPGTTRDVLREQLDIDGLPIHVLDTAGLRATDDVVETEGVSRARAELGRADHALVVVDASAADAVSVAALLAELPAGLGYTLIRNKVDLTGEAPGPASGDAAAINLVAITGAGLPALRTRLRAVAGYQPGGEGTVTARRRHLDALARARAHFDAACQVLEERQAGELMAEELLAVQNALAEITGEFSSDDLLGRIFGSFCIGK
ncbi:MAG: tRNA uridine-5-carboxymethylaminomethyl(34) synthesis GTPase MnmE [Gammaproteobacteria bacterium]|nr:MAG: tRNA uridine-5-carboxymethylaminomethyl(34) synthesis GTPase MnmE [Gammaproteobacteria bacterium]